MSQVIGTKELPNYIGYLHKALKTCHRVTMEDTQTDSDERELHGFALKVHKTTTFYITSL